MNDTSRYIMAIVIAMIILFTWQILFPGEQPNYQQENSQKTLLDDPSIPEIIAEGVSCDICHSVVMSSNSIHTTDAVAAVAEYYLNPGEVFKFGSIENPESNDFHSSQYSGIYSSSESCLPCHDQFIRDNPIEATFSEWGNSFNAMSGLNSCQQCHMPTMPDPSRPGKMMHSHYFAGVDVDLGQSINESSDQNIELKSILESSILMPF